MVHVLFASYFCSWTRFNLNVTRSNGSSTWRLFFSVISYGLKAGVKCLKAKRPEDVYVS